MPTTSSSVNGPMGCPQPSRIAVSMSAIAPDPTLQRPHRVEQIRDQEEVHEEPRRVLGDDCFLAEASGKGKASLEGVGTRGVGAHDLHQRHQGHGIEEVQSDESIRPASSRGHRLDGQARGVGGEDGARPAQEVQLRPEAVLDGEVLGDRLDDRGRSRRAPPGRWCRRGRPSAASRCCGARSCPSRPASRATSRRSPAHAPAGRRPHRARAWCSRPLRRPARCRCP